MRKRKRLGFTLKKQVLLCSTAIVLSYSVEMLKLKKKPAFDVSAESE